MTDVQFRPVVFMMGLGHDVSQNSVYKIRVENTGFGASASQKLQDAFDDFQINRTTYGIDRAIVELCGQFQIDSTVTIPDPDGITVDARAAEFNTDGEITMFDCNGRADPLFIDNESRQQFFWHGGRFACSTAFGSLSASTALLMRGFRVTGVFEAQFIGFFSPINFSAKDTIYFKRLKFQDNQHCIINTAWSRIGAILEVYITDCQFQHAISSAPAFFHEDPIQDLYIENYSCNLSNNADHSPAVFDLGRRMTLYVPTESEPFNVGQTLTGQTSGATCTIDRIRLLPNGATQLVCSNKSGTDFQAGEAVQDGGQTTSSNLTTEELLVNQNPFLRNIVIGPGHWEAGGVGGSLDVQAIKFTDHIGNGFKADTINIKNTGFILDGVNATMVDIDRARGVDFSSCYFYQRAATSNSVPIRFGVDVEDVTISRGCTFEDGAIDLNSMPRTELDLSGFNRTFSNADVTGYHGDTFSGTSNATIDMSTALAEFALAATLPPAGYDAVLAVRDSGSGGTSTHFRVAQDNTVAAENRSGVNLEGVTNNEWRNTTLFVPADTNGDIYADWIASGTDTMEVKLEITGVRY